MDNDILNIIFGILALYVLLYIYFIPSIVATKRSHHNRLAINILNIFLGWTFLGWVIALTWACINPIQISITDDAKESE